MILVSKPSPPARLLRGNPLIAEYRARFEADPAAYESNRKNFAIRRDIYGHSQVKGMLREAQHKKCCFCEGLFEAHAAADVEHYRPKAYSQQSPGAPKIYPGYYWLAYSWDNLFYCCQDCNRSHKKNFFPLRNPQARARNHHSDVASETPLILKPSGPDNPRGHIRFRKDIAVGITDAGETTVNIVCLNRLPLVEKRQGVGEALQGLHQVIQLLRNCPGKEQRDYVAMARVKLYDALKPQSEFSAMASDLLQEAGIPF